ncbi:MAG TPA: bifunctional methylenetetrahydrofolate dehydrogenase/methenyltetrahydrofolate cyclohydrolase FolD [Roseiarcus sp.]|jgi:methylenetetrahydrofolate dehydrogenase (NADP+)/methenyltetrahydrofolate cyclohydrolase|nr:bifunctional methylenetetrahydrofolate dehydrogenase/methenyltetrahydrofolate cyclohydrolase FolD [Roseiarcus sp.]
MKEASSSILKSSVGGALVIDGKAVSQALLQRIGEEARGLIARGVTPGLSVVIVGEDPASQVYVRSKGKAASELGFRSEQHDLSHATSEDELLALVQRLNADPRVHGILVQLPLPKHIRAARILEAVAPHKDVDGFHPINVGLAAIGETKRALIPCTPAGAMILIEKTCAALGETLAGKEAVVIGRSNIVGKPIARLLLEANCTVTSAHSRTRDLAGVARRADLLVAAVGQPELVRGDWIKPGAIVVDIGVNRIAAEGLNAAGKPRTRLVGDVAFAEAAEHAAAITPSPGGVGPMTIAMLMANTLLTASRAQGFEDPKL